MNKKVVLFLLFTFTAFASFSQAVLQNKLDDYCKKYNAQIGVGVKIIGEKNGFYRLNETKFPMMSVYKLHLAIYVLKLVDEGKLRLMQEIQFTEKDIFSNFGPLLEKFPSKKGKVNIFDLLNNIISYSDNNSCDLLFTLIGSPVEVEKFFHQKGFKGISIKWTEQQKHQKRSRIYENWIDLKTMTAILESLKNKKILSEGSTGLLMEFMAINFTGGKRLSYLIPGYIVAHKTGTSDQNSKGITEAVNDVGLIPLKNGRILIISVFVKDSRENEETNEKIIAEIAKICVDELESKK
jgi:beta-lactamase class A